MNCFLFLIMLISFYSLSQDTLFIDENYYYGNKIIQVNGTKDTIQYEYAKNGKLLSILPISGPTIPIHYIRFYSNGKKMWDKTLLNNIEHGNSIFYSESGKAIAELKFENGKISDTLFVHPKVHIFIGDITYSSIVYGGVELENGQSNISESTGAMSFYPFKLVEVTDKSKTEHHYTSDRFGKYFIGTPREEIIYGFFPDNYPTKLIKANTLFPESDMNMSGSSTWSLTSTFKVSLKSTLTEIHIQSSSVGYAP